MIYLLDTDTLIFMIRGLKSSNRHQASRERAQLERHAVIREGVRQVRVGRFEEVFQLRE